MPSQNKTIFIPLPLGPAGQYHRSVFPLLKFKSPKASLHEMDLALVATMDELIKMKQLVNDNAEFKKLIHESKIQYDDLLEDKETLANAMAMKTFNPFKMFSTYRAVRLLSEAGIALWMETLSKSERLRRKTLSVDTQDIQPVGDDDLPPDARISAIAIQAEAETHLDNTISFFDEATNFMESDLFQDRNPFSDVHEAQDLSTSAVA
ncbi:hypothetical protein EDB19DRAFT_1668623 [Suillus lakei]|nr:hypothetical protein EDB19DRAFT_1668623 [Suillus lakei]